jgi:hypothetical protein
VKAVGLKVVWLLSKLAERMEFRETLTRRDASGFGGKKCICKTSGGFLSLAILSSRVRRRSSSGNYAARNLQKFTGRHEKTSRNPSPILSRPGFHTYSQYPHGSLNDDSLAFYHWGPNYHLFRIIYTIMSRRAVRYWITGDRRIEPG